MRTSLKEFQRFCLEHQRTFVSYVMPGDENPVTIIPIDSKTKTYHAISDIDCTSGFILAPFQSENYPIIIIPDDQKVSGWEFDLKKYSQEFYNHRHIEASIEQERKITSYAEYENQIEEIKKSLSLGKAKKVVLSRIKPWNNISHHLLPDVFEELTKLYKHAFIYLLYTPESGIWLGATPESLIQISNATFSTMALAGTKEYTATNADTEWASKEIKEQEYVVSYVRQKLTKGDYPFQESERQTVKAGNVIHLRTLFTGKLKNGEAEWKKLVTLLYPTPAICGTDDITTLPLIQKTEKHKREYYAGIIGPFDTNDKIDLFINLRCMKVIGNSALLFAGGGILLESSAYKEWEETELKFNTLIQVIQKVMKNANKVE